MMLRSILSQYKSTLILTLLSIIIGAVVGAIDTLFGKVLIAITEFRGENVFKLLPFLCIAGAIIILLYKKFGKNSIKGMSLVFQTGNGEESSIPKRLIPLIMFTTWLTHLFGGSAGREGVAVQIGATVADNVGSKFSFLKDEKRTIVIMGMAAGFAGLFQTPIASVFFAIEVFVAGYLEYRALFVAIVAAFTASFTSSTLGLEKFSFALTDNITLDWIFIVKIIICGIVFGVVGGLFAHFLSIFKKMSNKIHQDPVIKIFIAGIVLSVLLLVLHTGRYSGLGTNLISMSFSDKQIYEYDWILKFVLTILTLCVGFQGGEVTPLFSIGASLGVAIASILNLPIEFIAAMGYVGVFGAATNTYLAPIFIGGEVFGFKYVPYFFIICSISYMFNGNKTIYTLQKRIEK